MVLCFTSSVLLPPLWGNLILAQQVGSDLGSFSAISFSSHEWGGGEGGCLEQVPQGQIVDNLYLWTNVQ